MFCCAHLFWFLHESLSHTHSGCAGLIWHDINTWSVAVSVTGPGRSCRKSANSGPWSVDRCISTNVTCHPIITISSETKYQFSNSVKILKVDVKQPYVQFQFLHGTPVFECYEIHLINLINWYLCPASYLPNEIQYLFLTDFGLPIPEIVLVLLEHVTLFAFCSIFAFDNHI